MANMSMLTFVGQLEDVLQDEDNDNWTVTKLIGWYNRAARFTVVKAPYANAKIESVLLAVGAKQQLPAEGIALLNVIRNMGTDGVTVGAACMPTLLKLLLAHLRNWSSTTASATVLNWAPETERIWYCYPKNTGTGYVEIEYSAQPATVVYDVGGDWETARVGVAEKYVDAVFNLTASMAFSPDTDYPGNADRQLFYYNLFLDAVGQPRQGTIAQAGGAR